MKTSLLMLVVFFGDVLSIYYAKKSLEKMNSQKKIRKTEIGMLHIFHLLFFLLIGGKNIEVFYYAMLSSLLLCMSITDAKEKQIVNELFVVLFFFAIISFFFVDKNINASFIGSLLAGFPLFLVLKIKEDSIGEGDLYLLLLLGFIVEIEGIYIVLLVAYLLAFLYSIVLCTFKKANRKSEIAMFPFFYIGYLMFLLFYA